MSAPPAGTGYAVEYAGSAIRDLPVEGRLTICNLSIELGAKMGLIAPDEKTFEYLRGRPYAPQGEMWEQAVAAWRQLPSDPDAVFDREVVIDVEKIIPQVTWGISPEHVIGVDGRVPDPGEIADPARRAAIETALDYMGLVAGRADRRHAGRLGLHRIMHQQPAQRSAGRCRDRARPQGCAGRPCLGRAGLGDRQARCGRRRARQDLYRCRLRMARARMLDVPCRQR